VVVNMGKQGDGSWKADFIEQNNPLAPNLLFSETVYLLNGDGVQQNMDNFVLSPSQLRDFSLINKPVAVNLSFSAPQWGGNTIDLLLLPDFLTSDF